jgi:diadenosine tetraphosphate (Ap4A) HIT family hydrolase
MWDGEDCGMCRDASLAHNRFGDLIAETEWSFVRLEYNQTQAGYSVVIAKRHAPELHHLTPDERCGFWNDVANLGEVISDQLRPVKLANLAMGFRMPHSHVHVYPQYQHDDPFGLLNPQDGDVRLGDAEWQDRLASIRAGFLALAGR